MRRGCLAAWVGLVGACGPAITLETDDGGAGSMGDGAPMSATAPAATTTTTSPPATGPVETTLPPMTDGPEDAPCFVEGGHCMAAPECCSGACYLLGALGGTCSECDDDSDCRFGCTAGAPYIWTPAVCGDGGLGSGCESEAACLPGLQCLIVYELPGAIAISTCGECGFDGDCGPDSGCAPVYDLASLGGFYTCVPDGSVPDGDGCLGLGAGDEQCASGNCADVSLMGGPAAWVCSECDEDADCGGGTCMLPELVIEDGGFVLVPGQCV